VKTFFTSSAQETEQLGKQIGETLEPGAVVTFFGEFGVGKTTFIKGLVEGASSVPSYSVNSPTFTYLNVYTGTKAVYHFDLYRLKDGKAFYQLGFDEYFTADGICLIEWSERIVSALPEKRIEITLEHAGENKRKITVEGT
jgi:tRNA threonylcarbamoyladenosine biosynthesis protein TsaE